MKQLRRLAIAAVLSLSAVAAAQGADEVTLSGSLAGPWQKVGRVEVTPGSGAVTIANGFLVAPKPLNDCELSFRGRAPQGAEQVQIWGAIRVKDRDSRYVVGLRGGVESQLSFARYAPDNKAKFLGFAPLDFTPAAGTWYTVRVVAIGTWFRVYLNDEALPRISIDDKDAPWREGGIALGGGWLPTEFTDLKATTLTGDAIAAYKAMGDKTWQPPAVDKEALRAKQRAAYQPAHVAQLPEVRGEIPLDGTWLFKPDQERVAADAAPITLDAADQDWHAIAVPGFWTPTIGWLHGERGLPGLKGLSASKGPSDALVTEEEQRVTAQTFDWDKTKSGWYRHYVELPDVSGRQVRLVFDAVAKIADVWVNGAKVGSNVGMFREIDCDVSATLKPGRNVIAVHVVGNPGGQPAGADKVEAVAVTVNVTSEMINSLPHGMTDNRSGGIWQPVRLVVTNPVRFAEPFIQPRLDGATVEVELANAGAQARTVSLSYAIRDAKDGSVLDAKDDFAKVEIAAKGTAVTKLQTPTLKPKWWSPTAPNLYVLELRASDGKNAVDRQETRFGFRTFTVDGNRFLLNGRPYWLRGGNHFPATIRPNDGALARKFMQLAREGNVQVTRSHALPFTKTWLDAADEVGMGVSYEGTWPWLMIKGEPPKPELIKVWKEEFADLLRKNRNHPSLLFWTVNNEMNFAKFDEADLELMKRKWVVLDDMIRTMRAVDPTRPISAYSGYMRKETKKGFAAIVAPGKLDDGDIDDSHSYFGWYRKSFFNLFDGQYGHDEAVPDRPLISQEMSTGYPRNDDWPSRSYQFPRYVPQALVGDFCYEQNPPSIFMTRQAFMTKELAETIRRSNRQETAGVLHFAYLTWFTDVWKADAIKPKLTYFEIKKALQSVLVSAELYGRHFYAGDSITRRVCIVNDADDLQAVPIGTLNWEIRAAGKAIAQGRTATPAVPYYSNQWLDVTLAIPDALATPRVDGQLVLRLEAGGKTVSENTYDVVLATRAWVQPPALDRAQLFDPKNTAADALAGIRLQAISSPDQFKAGVPVIIGDLAALLKLPDGDAKLKKFVENGGRALLLRPGAALATLFPDQVKSYRATKGEITTMHVPESPVFDGIQPLDTAWFEMGERNLPYACSGTYELDRDAKGVVALADQCDFHPDIKNQKDFFSLAGTPLLAVRIGKGVVFASEMMLAAAAKDPIAGRLRCNLLASLLATP